MALDYFPLFPLKNFLFKLTLKKYYNIILRPQLSAIWLK